MRDSAAYVLWALVRAQSVEVLAPYLLEIALRLTTTSLFDREVHVRRAASAAYQEAVGRTVRIFLSYVTFAERIVGLNPSWNRRPSGY